MGNLLSSKLPVGLQRPLGEQELMFYECHNLDIFNISVALFVSSDHEITRAHLEHAMTCMMMRHPMLRMRVTRHRGHLYWQEMNDVAPDVRVQEHTH